MKVWKRKDRDVWVIDYRDRTGKRVRMVGGKTQEAAYLAFSKRQLEEATAPVVPVKDADITVAEYADRWLKTVKRDLAQRTYRSYTQHVTLHLVPTLGVVKLRDLRRRDIVALIAEKRMTLGKHAVRLMKATLSSMLAQAVDAELISVNVALGQFKAQGQTDGAVEINPMSRAQLAQFMQTMETDVSGGSASVSTPSVLGDSVRDGHAARVKCSRSKSAISMARAGESRWSGRSISMAATSRQRQRLHGWSI